MQHKHRWSYSLEIKHINLEKLSGGWRSFENPRQSIERWATSVAIINARDQTESQLPKVERQSERKHCTCQLITGASVWQQSCLQDGRQLPCSQGKYLALLLYSQDSLCCKRTQTRGCQELPVPLPAKSFNRGFNLLNETDIDLGRVVRFESRRCVDSNN